MKVSKLIIHCSDSAHDHHGVEEIRRWHKERGWTDIGYHYVIERSGELKKGRLTYPGAHTLGQNNETGICLCGLSADFNNDQMATLERFILENHNLITEVRQHSDFEPKKPFCAGLTDSQMKYLNSII